VFAVGFLETMPNGRHGAIQFYPHVFGLAGQDVFDNWRIKLVANPKLEEKSSTE
jgi:hypothetical protein